MSFSYSVSYSDPNNLASSTVDAALVHDLDQALTVWSKYLSGLGTLVVSLNVKDTAVGRAEGGPTASFLVATVGGLSIVESSAQYELATGQHVGATTSDITINVDPDYFSFLDLDPNLSYDSATPNNVINPIIVFLHELDHAFGMSGFYNQSGMLVGSFETVYDQYINITSSSTFFTGPTSEAVFGGPVPLTSTSTTQNIYHFGRLRTP